MTKQYLTLAALLTVAAASSAKELTFYVENKPVEQNADVAYTPKEGEVTQDGDYTVYMIKPEMSLHADFVGEVAINVVSNRDVSVCVDLCYSGKDINFTKLMSSGENLKLDYDLMGEIKGSTEIPSYVSTFTAYYTDDEEATKKSFTIHVNSPSGVEVLALDNNGLSVIEGGIAYALEAPATLTLHSLAGQTVLTAPLSGTGVLSTSNLPSGIYIYTLNGKAGKIAL